MTISAIGAIERVEIDHRDRVDDEPRQVIVRQPIPHIGRHQERLTAITSDEVLSHPVIVLNPPDSTRFTRQPRVVATLRATALLLAVAVAQSRVVRRG